MREAKTIKELANLQVEAGADYLDVNCGSLLQESEAMEWLVKTIQEAISIPLCIDSPNSKVLEVGLGLSKGPSIVNSITAERERYTDILPLILNYNAKVIALCIGDEGMPSTAQDRLRIASKLITDLVDAGVDEDDIYIDPLVRPISTGHRLGLDVLNSIRMIKEFNPKVHLICGISNVSYGLPMRKLLNRTFLVQTMTVGMDAYILDPTDKDLVNIIYTSQALLGEDEYCNNYLKAYRKELSQMNQL